MLIFLFLLLFVSLLLYSNGYINHIRYTSKVTCNKSIKLTAWDKEIAKGQEYLDKIAKKKELKKRGNDKIDSNNKVLKSSSKKQSSSTPPYISNQNNLFDISDKKQITKVKSYATQTVWGQNIINCRDFSIDGIKDYKFLGSYINLNEIPIYPIPEIAFIGRSNVGKSSLLNSLTGLNRKIAIESKTPGRTQCINLFKCSDKEGELCIFTDLPGYGFAKMSKMQQENVSSFLYQYLVNRSSLRMAILLIDIRREPQNSDLEMINLLNNEGIPYFIVATKSDKVVKEELSKTINNLKNAFLSDVNNDVEMIPFSSITGEGRKDIWRAIRNLMTEEGDNDENIDDDDDDENYDDDEN
jgi:GTP-binding protein